MCKKTNYLCRKFSDNENKRIYTIDCTAYFYKKYSEESPFSQNKYAERKGMKVYNVSAYS